MKIDDDDVASNVGAVCVGILLFVAGFLAGTLYEKSRCPFSGLHEEFTTYILEKTNQSSWLLRE